MSPVSGLVLWAWLEFVPKSFREVSKAGMTSGSLGQLGLPVAFFGSYHMSHTRPQSAQLLEYRIEAPITKGKPEVRNTSPCCCDMTHDTIAIIPVVNADMLVG